MVKPAFPLIAGIGIGAIAGYVARGTIFVYQDYDAVRPQIDLVRSNDLVPITPTTPVNMLQKFNASFLRYPPNTQLVALQVMQETGQPPITVGVGVTDANGNLFINNIQPMSVGTHYIHAWDGPTGKYIAIATLFVTSA